MMDRGWRDAPGDISSIPSLSLLVVANELQVNVERLEHHIHREGLAKVNTLPIRCGLVNLHHHQQPSVR